MVRFILKRLTIIPLAILVAHFIGFTYAHFTGRRAVQMTGQRVEPLLPAYSAYMKDAMQLEFGTLVEGEVTVAGVVSKAAAASLGLLGISFALSIVVGLFLGIWAAHYDPPGISWWMSPLSTVGLAMPSFFIGSFLIAASIIYLIQGGPNARLPLPLQGFGWDQHLILPMVVLMARPTVQIAQITANLLSTEFGKQYVTAARSFGHTWANIRRRLAMRNTLTPILLTIAASFRLLIGDLIIVEMLFAWPGLGRLFYVVMLGGRGLAYRAYIPDFLNRSPPLGAALIAILAALFLLVDFGVAILIRRADPRLLTSQDEIRA